LKDAIPRPAALNNELKPPVVFAPSEDRAKPKISAFLPVKLTPVVLRILGTGLLISGR
jgi:hypothetical protein